MTNYDLPAALKSYRLEHKLSLSQMGKKLNMSKSSYNRLEKGVRKPYHDELVTIIQKLQLDVDPKDISSIPKPDPKWYQSKKLPWLIPIVIASIVPSLLLEMRGFRAGFTEEALESGAPIKTILVCGAVFCGICWYFWTPEWPKRKPTLSEVIYSFAGITVYLLLFFFDELSQTIMKWTNPYLRDVSAGPWIVLALIASLLSLVLWSFKKPKFFSFSNTVRKRLTFLNIKKYL